MRTRRKSPAAAEKMLMKTGDWTGTKRQLTLMVFSQSPQLLTETPQTLSAATESQCLTRQTGQEQLPSLAHCIFILCSHHPGVFQGHIPCIGQLETEKQEGEIKFQINTK